METHQLNLKLQDGTHIKSTVFNFGATLASLQIIGLDQAVIDIVLGTDTAEEYVQKVVPTSNPYFGICGRTCNRISKGEFSVDGVSYHLAKNNGPNNLHGGPIGFDKKLWKVIQDSQNIDQNNGDSITFEITSPSGDQGFPGDVKCQVKYTLQHYPEIGENGQPLLFALDVEFKAELLNLHDEDKDNSMPLSTIVNLTNHTYWNLSGFRDPTILDHILQIPNASGYLEVDDNQIPSGNVISDPNDIALNFTHSSGNRIRDSIEYVQRFRGYDHFYLTGLSEIDKMHMACSLTSKSSGLTMELWTDHVGVQVYTGNWLDGKIPLKSKQKELSSSYGLTHSAYEKYAGIALEPSAPPDAINHSQWRHLVHLSKQKLNWNHRVQYKFFLSN